MEPLSMVEDPESEPVTSAFFSENFFMDVVNPRPWIKGFAHAWLIGKTPSFVFCRLIEFFSKERETKSLRRHALLFKPTYEPRG